MSFNDDKQKIERYIKNVMNKVRTKRLPNPENAGYNVYNEAWAIVIAADIRNYKEMVASYQRWAIIRIIQAYTNSLISAVSESDNFVDAYVNGDEVLMVFRGDTKEKISQIFEDTLVHINSIANYLLPNLLKENGYDYEFKVGIGCWLSNNNSLIKYGERRGHSFFTTMGDSINYASALAKIANKNHYKQILYNYALMSNLEGKAKEQHSKWSQYQLELYNQSIYGCSVRFDEYDE